MFKSKHHDMPLERGVWGVTREQFQFIRVEAARLRISASALVRKIIDAFMKETKNESNRTV